MPRLPGLSFSDPEVRQRLTATDQREIARALGETRAALDALSWEHPGDYSPVLEGIAPLETPFADWMIASARDLLDRARRVSAATTDADVAWVDDVIAQSRAALAEPLQPAFVHRDFTGQNCVGERTGAGWRITSVFDLMEGYAGDPEADLSRSAAWYGTTDPDALRAFLGAYIERRPPRPGFAERFPFYMLLDRLLIWEYGQHNGIWFEAGVALRDWAEPFTIVMRNA